MKIKLIRNSGRQTASENKYGSIQNKVVQTLTEIRGVGFLTPTNYPINLKCFWYKHPLHFFQACHLPAQWSTWKCACSFHLCLLTHYLAGLSPLGKHIPEKKMTCKFSLIHFPVAYPALVTTPRRKLTGFTCLSTIL